MKIAVRPAQGEAAPTDRGFIAFRNSNRHAERRPRIASRSHSRAPPATVVSPAQVCVRRVRPTRNRALRSSSRCLRNSAVRNTTHRLAAAASCAARTPIIGWKSLLPGSEADNSRGGGHVRIAPATGFRGFPSAVKTAPAPPSVLEGATRQHRSPIRCCKSQPPARTWVFASQFFNQ